MVNAQVIAPCSAVRPESRTAPDAVPPARPPTNRAKTASNALTTLAATPAPAPSTSRVATAPGAEAEAVQAGRPAAGSAAAALASKDYARCLSILDRQPSRSAADRETEGWCLLGAERPAEAAEAFRAAGSRASAQAASDSALGETLSDLRQGNTAAAVDSAARAPLGADRRRDLGLQILSRQALDAYRGGRWAEALDLLRRRSAFAAEPRDLTLLRGWSLYHQGDYQAARRAFAEADGQLSDHDSRNALATVETVTTNKAFR